MDLFDILIQNGLNADNPFSTMWFIFSHGGFIVFIAALLQGFALVWLKWRQDIFYSKIKWVYLAIDVPKNNEQSPKAVEQIFNHIWGIIKKPNLIEKWWNGFFQVSFSFELVSIEGYLQYIIHTQSVFRDLLEAAIYAQYPEAQIAEIEDYTQEFTPQNFKEKGYEIWGTQMGLANSEAYPIKTYPLFEHTIAQQIIDPMAAILEIMSRLSKGEQAWLQMVVKPVDETWKEKSKAEVKKLIGAPAETKGGDLIDKLMDVPYGVAKRTGDVVFGPAAAAEKKETKMEMPSKMLYLSPGERETVEFVDRKATKTGFKIKMRYIYLAKKDIFSKAKGASGMVGALRQFALLNSNAFKPIKGSTTKADYYRVEERVLKIQRKLLKGYKSRTHWGGWGGDGFILNTEELASVYHFPYLGVVAPTLKTVEAKRAEAPFALPIEEEVVEEEKKISGVEKKMGPPENLPL